MAQKPPKGPDARAVTAEAIENKVDIDMRDFYTRMSNRAAEYMKEGQQRGLQGEALADYVVGGARDLSNAPIQEMGRAATSEAYNLGRNLEAQRRLPEIGQVVRSEILDENTCENCEAIDLAVCEMNGPIISMSAAGYALFAQESIDPDGPDAYFALMAPNFCLGEDFCRGEMVYRRAA